MKNITIRTSVSPADKNNVREILESSHFFHDFEIDVAIELVQEYLDNGKKSGYFFVFADGWLYLFWKNSLYRIELRLILDRRFRFAKRQWTRKNTNDGNREND